MTYIDDQYKYKEQVHGEAALLVDCVSIIALNKCKQKHLLGVW